MTQILKPTGLTRHLEYRVERYNELYLVTADNSHYNCIGQIDANLYLDKIDGKANIRLWKPHITNPFHTEIVEKEKLEKQFSLADVMLTMYTPFENFVEHLNNGLLSKYNRKMDLEDATAFFGKVYCHYNQKTG